MSDIGLIPTEKILERLHYENPWWISSEIPEAYGQLRKRAYFSLFYPLIVERDVRRAVVLMGPRRVGKTVLLFHSIQQLLADQVHPHRLFFIGIDNPIYVHLSLEDLLKLCKQSLHRDNFDGCFIFFDEIQYLKDWERHLKVLVDMYPRTQFVVSGSAAAALKWYSTESGAGRFTDFMLPPLTFHEYIHLRQLDHLMFDDSIWLGEKKVPYTHTHDVKALNKEFINYLNFGGYPEVVINEKVRGDLGRYVKSDIVDKVLLRDLPSLYGIRDVQELNRFFSFLAYQTGQEQSYEKLSQDSGIQKDTLRKYLDYLEAAFLIQVLHKIDINAKRMQRISRFKVYLTNTSLRSALFSPVVETDREMGPMVETALLSQWMHQGKSDLTYARWKEGRNEGEVDLVRVDDKSYKPLWGLEIKWSNRYFEKPGELKSLLNFCQTHRFKTAMVTTLDQWGTKSVADVTLSFIPAAVFCYNAGLLQQQNPLNSATTPSPQSPR